MPIKPVIRQRYIERANRPDTIIRWEVPGVDTLCDLVWHGNNDVQRDPTVEEVREWLAQVEATRHADGCPCALCWDEQREKYPCK